MIDFRFTGRGADNEYVDIRFRTDAISSTDQTFNITQIQKGQEFHSIDKQDAIYQKHFGATFKETNTTLGAMTQFAIDHNYDLRSYDKNGVETFLVNDASASQS